VHEHGHTRISSWTQRQQEDRVVERLTCADCRDLDPEEVSRSQCKVSSWRYIWRTRQLPYPGTRSRHSGMVSTQQTESGPPLSVDHQRCRVRMNQALWANATIIAALLFGQRVNGWTCSSPNPAFSCADAPRTRREQTSRSLRSKPGIACCGVVGNQGRRADGVEGGNAKQRFREPRRTAERAERI